MVPILIKHWFFGAKIFCKVWPNLIILFHFKIFPYLGEGPKKKVFATNCFYSSWALRKCDPISGVDQKQNKTGLCCILVQSKSRISDFLFASWFSEVILLNLKFGACFRSKTRICLECQEGIVCQKTEGARHFNPFSVRPKPALPPCLQKSMPVPILL